MIQEPLVSIIIPNYNHAPYLDQRIKSVLNQTYQNIEVIILDDNSPDNSLEVINKYKDDPRVSHIVANVKNSGSTFKQWNKGLELSRGEIIWIAESDDFCTPDFLEVCVSEYLKIPECSVVYCSSEYVDAQGNDLGTYSRYNHKLYEMTGSEFIKNRMAFGCDIWNASSAIFNKRKACEVDKIYQTYRACGDKLFWIFMAERGNVGHVNKIMNFFRQHQNKVSPKRLRDGTSFKEEREIYKYQCSKRYIYGFKRLYILNLYLRKINSTSFDSEQIKDDVIRLWGFDKAFKRHFSSLVSRLYIYFNLYVLRKKAI